MSASFEGIGAAAAVVFLFVFLAAAFIAYKLLKRTVKMAMRLAIVGIILAVAIGGSFALWWAGSSKPSRPEPRVIRTR
jgi:uncharacterized membrane protein